MFRVQFDMNLTLGLPSKESDSFIPVRNAELLHHSQDCCVVQIVSSILSPTDRRTQTFLCDRRLYFCSLLI